jgi:hypothetical protein
MCDNCLIIRSVGLVNCSALVSAALRWSCRLALVSGLCAGACRLALVSGRCAGHVALPLYWGVALVMPPCPCIGALRWCLSPCPCIGALRWCLPPCPCIGALHWSCRLALVSGRCVCNGHYVGVSGLEVFVIAFALVFGVFPTYLSTFSR